MWKQEIKSKTLKETNLDKFQKKSETFLEKHKDNAGYKNNSGKKNEWCSYFKSLLCPETKIETIKKKEKKKKKDN